MYVHTCSSKYILTHTHTHKQGLPPSLATGHWSNHQCGLGSGLHSPHLLWRVFQQQVCFGGPYGCMYVCVCVCVYVCVFICHVDEWIHIYRLIVNLTPTHPHTHTHTHTHTRPFGWSSPLGTSLCLSLSRAPSKVRSVDATWVKMPPFMPCPPKNMRCMKVCTCTHTYVQI
jgi:hypothetical protein